MNQSYYSPYTSPVYVPPSPQDTERQQLRSAAGFIGLLMLILCATMQFTYVAVALLLSFIGFLPPNAMMQDQLGLDNTTYLCVYACVYTLAMGLPLLLVIGKRRFFQQKFEKKPHTAGVSFLAVLGAVGGCMGANIATSILMTILENWNVPMPEMPDMMEQTPISLLLNVVVIAVLPAILEELVFRGCVLRVLRPFGDGFAVAISAVLFGLMHGNIRQIPFALIVGLILGWLYVVTNSIWWPMAVHFINNALSVCMDYLSYGLSENGTAVFFSGIIYGLTLVGALAFLILLFVRGSQFRMTRNQTCLKTSDKVSATLSAPAFIIALIVFVILTGLELMM